MRRIVSKGKKDTEKIYYMYSPLAVLDKGYGAIILTMILKYAG
jgi:hypothetical protein